MHESLNIKSRLNHLKKVMITGSVVYVPDNLLFDDDTLRKFRATILSKMMGVKLNTALNYTADSTGPAIPEEYIFINNCKEYCNSIISELENTMTQVLPEDNLQNALIGNALIRLQASLETAVFLSYEGFNFETKTILRLILENLNFVYQVANVTDNEETFINNFIRSHRITNTNVTAIKEFYQNVDLGKLYGILSNYTHFDWKTQNTMFVWEGKDEGSVYLKSVQFVYENYLILIVLLELLQEILDFVYKHTPNYKQNLNRLTPNEITGLRYPKSLELIELISKQKSTQMNKNFNLIKIFRFKDQT